MHELGEMIKRARGRMTGQQLAVQSKVPSWKISRIETGSYKDIPDPTVIQGLSDALRIPQYEMLRVLGYDVGPPGSERSGNDDPRIAALAERLRETPIPDQFWEGLFGIVEGQRVTALQRAGKD